MEADSHRAGRMGYHDYHAELERVEARNAALRDRTGMWDWGNGQCMWCGAPTGRRYGSHCRARHCRTIERFYNAGGCQRRQHMHGALFPLYIIAGFLRAMARSEGKMAKEFSKRYAHRVTR